MPRAAKNYAYSVIAIGVIIMAMSLRAWPSPEFRTFSIYFGLAIIASMIKFTLPGIDGTYSASFLFTLFGIAEFTLPETLAVTLAGALVQSFWKVKQRPTRVQILFNLANLTISTSLCFLIAHSILSGSIETYRPAMLALVAAIYFASSTVLVSGILSILQGQSLSHICREWYFWAFPYYLIGAAFVGLLPLSGKVPVPEGWLILLPLLYLVHFYYRLRTDPVPAVTAAEINTRPKLAPMAAVYIFGVIAAGTMLMVVAAWNWESANLIRFSSYLAMALLAGTYKVRLPRLVSTISVSFVVILVAIAELSYAEAAVISACVALMQTLWRTQSSRSVIRALFNSGSLVLSTSVTYYACHALVDSGWSTALPAFLVTATVLLYGTNTALVTTVVCLTERKPIHVIWQQCYFWSLPYYLVGAAASGLMIATARTAGWPFSFLVLPLLTMVYVSYRLHARPRAVAEAHA